MLSRLEQSRRRPYKIAAENAMEIRADPVQMAKEHERKAPMVAHGLADAVEAIVNEWPTVAWDEDLGIVKVTDAA